MKNLIKFLRIIVTIVIIVFMTVSCSNDPRKAYFGTWQESWVDSTGETATSTVTISVNKIENHITWDNRVYIMENLTWTPINNPINDYIEVYPSGYAITGTLTMKYSDGTYSVPFTDKDAPAEVGEICRDYWYIHSNRKSIAQGNWRSVNHEPFGENHYYKE